jgi:hypothetical protein
LISEHGVIKSPNEKEMPCPTMIRKLSLNVSARERRVIAAVKSQVTMLATYHDLTPAQFRPIISDQLLSDKECWSYYLWACQASASGFGMKDARRKLKPTVIAAETII